MFHFTSLMTVLSFSELVVAGLLVWHLRTASLSLLNFQSIMLRLSLKKILAVSKKPIGFTEKGLTASIGSIVTAPIQTIAVCASMALPPSTGLRMKKRFKSVMLQHAVSETMNRVGLSLSAFSG